MRLGAVVADAYGRLGSHWRVRRLTLALLLFVLVGLPSVIRDDYMIRTLDLAGLYVLLSLGLNIVVGYAGLLDLGYVAFYAVGAYLYALLASPQLGYHLPFLVIFVMGGALAALAGALIGAPTLRLRGDYLAIVTMAFGEIIRILMNNLDWLTNGPQGIIQIDAPTIFGVQLDTPLRIYYLILPLCVLVVFLISNLEQSKIGRAWAAIREDEDAARAMGLNTRNLKLLAFAMGATTAGAAGVIFAGLQQFVSPESFTFWESILILCMVVLGGMGSIPGVIVGSVTLIVLPEMFRQYSDYRMIFFGLSLTVMMLVRPEGIWPSRSRGPELQGDGAAGLPGDPSEQSSSLRGDSPRV
jgi:branched-chain amino acid transport system permease protein